VKDLIRIGYAVVVIRFLVTNGSAIVVTDFQVFDLGEMAPDKVLHQLYATLETLKYSGDDLAAKIQNKLRIIVSLL
jgi:hypothetical protein